MNPLKSMRRMPRNDRNHRFARVVEKIIRARPLSLLVDSLSLTPPLSIPVHVHSSQTRPNSHRLLAMQNLPPTSGKVVITTNIGDIDVELWTKEAPLACRNFVQLCMEVGSDPPCPPE